MKTNGKTVPPWRTRTLANSNQPDTAELARCIAAYAPHDGTFDLSIPALHASRYSRINTDCVHALHLPALCMIAQGEKTTNAGQDV